MTRKRKRKKHVIPKRKIVCIIVIIIVITTSIALCLHILAGYTTESYSVSYKVAIVDQLSSSLPNQAFIKEATDIIKNIPAIKNAVNSCVSGLFIFFYLP